MGDSSGNAGDATASNTGGGGARRPHGALASFLIAAATILVFFVGIPYALLALAFWAADGSWDFEGDNNFRYWFFISGKRTEQLGLVAQTEKPVKYSFSGSDGNFPGWTVVSYESKAAPADVIEAYAKRCEALKAKVTKRKASEQNGDTIGLHLACEFAGYLTAEFYAERKSASAVSEVSLRVWGME